jgi:hypothetical protein
MKYKLHDTIVNVSIKKYRNGRPAITIQDEEGLPYMTATLNVASDSPVALEDVVIKDYSENEGIYQWLVERNIILPAYASISLAHGNYAPICELNPEEVWKDETNVLEDVDDYLD